MMQHLGFTGSNRFIKLYSLMCIFILAGSIIVSFIAVMEILYVESLVSFLTLGSILLLFGQIVLAISYVNKENPFGWIIHRMSYITLSILVLSCTFLALGSYMSSFYLIGSNSIGARSSLSSISVTLTFSFGLCLSAIGYHTLRIESVWKMT